MPRGVTCLFLTLLALLTGACSDGADKRGPIVLAASSMQDGLDEAANAWAGQGHARPVLSFGGTASLARQVEAGAPADIFISADEQWMDELARKGLILHRTRADLVGNELVLIAPAGSDVKLPMTPGVRITPALGNGRLAMADPASVPAGRYAQQALTRMDVWSALSGNITRSESVRAALALVARGEAPLGIVYASDARAEPAVRVVSAFPAESHVPIVYPIALLKASGHSDAEPFRAFLLSPEGQAILRRHGFKPAGVR